MEEEVLIVDEHNNAIGSAPRSVMRSENLPHRATYCLVFNSDGRLFIQKRTATKDIYPSHWDICAGGVVLKDESYEEAAQRELSEELGVSGVELEFLFDFFFKDETNSVWGRAFKCIHNGPFVLQKEEVEKGMFISIEDLFEMIKREPFTPDGILLLKRLRKEGHLKIK